MFSKHYSIGWAGNWSAIFLTGPVQVADCFFRFLRNILATSCERLPDVLTIADLDSKEHIDVPHVLEALQYRVGG